MQILSWAIIATISSGGLGYLAFKLWRKRLADRDQFISQITDLRVTLQESQKEIKRRDHIIKAMEGVNREAAEKKKNIRKGGADSARRATELMRKLAGDGDSDGDGSPAGD